MPLADTDPRRGLVQARAFFRSKVPVPDHEWELFTDKTRARAFKVAGVAQLDLIEDVWTSLDQAVADGSTLEEFVTQVGPKLSRAWGEDRPWHLETIFRTNLQTSYSAGRYEQATDPEVMAVRPFWLFDAILDARTTTVCEACNGTILPADHPWWATHLPPLHFNCRSSFATLTEPQALRMGIVKQAPLEPADDGFGRVPDDSHWEPKASDYPGPLWSRYQARQKDPRTAQARAPARATVQPQRPRTTPQPPRTTPKPPRKKPR